ncbi:sigma-70 family RNA polymerase sigma factor [Acinetobacter qingfengensis]|uniref:RNA polymerase subunit sigma n=1 Tax=Acinetobacter qingfengensis TaxID=1262585 RepID=A0A1E7RA74_9GAMM|nr:sigma-70 family RNA polymerase sigma factor [Acinetobacter qingfengensis]KAA8730883.1 sigma-70 family RNA polymerase sigma factor [Acinetobacter qingfengensis]OEY96147.1 RNA polymerase subunit sigma [Acinetobacter qingfengensis]
MTDSSILIEQLYKQHKRWLHDWLRHKMGQSDQAADLVQETFLKVLQTRDSLLGIQEPKAYLTTIAKNLMLDQIRRKRIEQAYLDELSEMQYLLDVIPSVEQQIEMMQAIDQICQVLSNVSGKAQQAFLQHYFEGKTHKEIAAQLNVSTKMIQKYLAQCLLQCYRLKHSIQ